VYFGEYESRYDVKRGMYSSMLRKLQMVRLSNEGLGITGMA
jgi:hypothetical protein